jgi:hypothetical protein
MSSNDPERRLEAIEGGDHGEVLEPDGGDAPSRASGAVERVRIGSSWIDVDERGRPVERPEREGRSAQRVRQAIRDALPWLRRPRGP